MRLLMIGLVALALALTLATGDSTVAGAPKGEEITLDPFVHFCQGELATIILYPEGPDVHQLGTPGDDVVVGTAGDDLFSGLGGDDLICLGAGDDFADGGDGNDRLYGGAGADRLFGDDGRDRVSAGRGDDTLWGDLGNDLCDGGPGKDRAPAKGIYRCEETISAVTTEG